MTDKERKELERSEVGLCVSALTDPKVTQEEINNAEINSLLGKGLQAFAINYKQTGGGVDQSLTELWDEIGKKSDETSVAARFNDTATKSFVNEVVDVKVNKTEFDDLAATVDIKADKADLATKVDKSDVLSLTSRVDNLSTEVSNKASLSYVDNQVATKASTTAVDDLSSSVTDLNIEVLNNATIVDNLSSRVNTLSLEVENKASANDVEDLASRVDDLDTEVLSKVSAKWFDDIEVSASGWSTTAPYTKSITVEGINASHRLFVDLSTQNVDTASIEAKKEYYACVDNITPGSNTLTFTCLKEKPAGSFNIKVVALSCLETLL